MAVVVIHCLANEAETFYPVLNTDKVVCTEDGFTIRGEDGNAKVNIKLTRIGDTYTVVTDGYVARKTIKAR